MAVELKMYGLKDVQNMLLVLPKVTEEEVNLVDKQFMETVQDSARLRAPSFSGALAESIVFKQNKKNTYTLTVESPYGFFQEYGWNAKSIWAFMPANGTPYAVGDWMSAKGMGGLFFKPSGKPHPFVQPALEKGLNVLPSLMQYALLQAARKSARSAK